MKKVFFSFYFSITMLLLLSCSSPLDTEIIAIEDVTLIDAIHGVREHKTVLLQGDEIIAIKDIDSVLPEINERISGEGKYLIPGLWDMHVHLTYDDEFTDSMPSLFLGYGITSVRDTGGLIQNLKPVIIKMKAPDAIAPRVFFSGPLLDGKFVVYDGGLVPEIGTQNSTAEIAREKVATLKAEGVDFIKIYEMVDPGVFSALVEAAHEHNLPIAAHVPLSMLASTAGPSVDSMEHLRNIELDCANNSAELYEERLSVLGAHQEGPGLKLRSSLHSLQRLPAINNYDEARCNKTLQALTSTIQVPTLRLNTFSTRPPYLHDDWEEVLTRVPENLKNSWVNATKEWLESDKQQNTTFADWSLFLIGQMHQQGVPIGAGTDTPIGYALPGYSLHTELERLVEAGLSPLEALHSATIRPAEFFSLLNSMGTIEVGKVADLVLLDADPMQDISNTRKISAVVSKGIIYNPNDLFKKF